MIIRLYIFVLFNILHAVQNQIANILTQYVSCPKKLWITLHLLIAGSSNHILDSDYQVFLTPLLKLHNAMYLRYMACSLQINHKIANHWVKIPNYCIITKKFRNKRFKYTCITMSQLLNVMDVTQSRLHNHFFFLLTRLYSILLSFHQTWMEVWLCKPFLLRETSKIFTYTIHCSRKEYLMEF